FVAIDLNHGASGAWDANGGSGNSLTVAQGGAVTFSYPTGMSWHWVQGNTGQPTPACTGMATGISNGGPGWSGSCRFDTPGTYAFVCGLHMPSMNGTITADA